MRRGNTAGVWLELSLMLDRQRSALL